MGETGSVMISFEIGRCSVIIDKSKLDVSCYSPGAISTRVIAEFPVEIEPFIDPEEIKRTIEKYPKILPKGHKTIAITKLIVALLMKKGVISAYQLMKGLKVRKHIKIGKSEYERAISAGSLVKTVYSKYLKKLE